ncbi:unnamed protein product [Linum tenue]|uniref:Uncharacterized protein n=1 Tax=Linum tenue TaxID=586396 RepID=A0AAV0H6U3_9ROSI|nr:unnamed protein product [Linum tenue]CAI0380726.1 unnamed protein product [Linum tenue]
MAKRDTLLQLSRRRVHDQSKGRRHPNPSARRRQSGVCE